MTYPRDLTITLHLDEEWWEWTVTNDPNDRNGTYFGATTLGPEDALEDALRTIKEKARHPYDPKARTEY